MFITFSSIYIMPYSPSHSILSYRAIILSLYLSTSPWSVQLSSSIFLTYIPPFLSLSIFQPCPR